MKVNLNLANSMVKGFTNGMMEEYMKVNSKMGKCMGLANTLWKMVDISKAHLKKGNQPRKGNIFGQMGQSIKKRRKKD